MVLDGSKVAVVVGASRGIGFALAKRLSEKGHEVFATCRTTNDDIDSISAQCSNFHTVSGAPCALLARSGCYSFHATGFLGTTGRAVNSSYKYVNTQNTVGGNGVVLNSSQGRASPGAIW